MVCNSSDGLEVREFRRSAGGIPRGFSRLDATRVAKEKALPFELRVPNKLTAATFTKSERGEDVHHAKDAEDLFGQLGI